MKIMSIDDSCLGIFGKNHFTDKLKYNSLFISKIVLHNIISASYLETIQRRKSIIHSQKMQQTNPCLIQEMEMTIK